LVIFWIYFDISQRAVCKPCWFVRTLAIRYWANTQRESSHTERERVCGWERESGRKLRDSLLSLSAMWWVPFSGERAHHFGARNSKKGEHYCKQRNKTNHTKYVRWVKT